MTSVLSELQAGYDQRAKQALEAPVSPPAAPEYHFATRTYTGQALARRQAWGRKHGAWMKERAAAKRREAV